MKSQGRSLFNIILVKEEEDKDVTIGTSSSEGSGEVDYYVYDYDAVHFTTPGPKGKAGQKPFLAKNCFHWNFITSFL